MRSIVHVKGVPSSAGIRDCMNMFMFNLVLRIRCLMCFGILTAFSTGTIHSSGKDADMDT